MGINTVNETIRKNVGSPSTWFEFTQKTNSVSIDNHSSVGVYGNFSCGTNAGSVTAGSENFYIAGNDAKAFDVICGSVNLCASGTSASGVEVLGLM